MNKKIRRPFLPTLVGICLPVGLLFLWHSNYVSYPQSDAGGDFFTTQEIFLKFQNLGFIEGLRAAIFERHWKPILHPAISPVFLFLTRGAVLPAVYLAVFFWYVLFLFYVSKISATMLPARTSWLPTLLVGTTSWIFISGSTFNSEMPFLACVMPSFYHLIKADQFSSKKHSSAFGFWMALSICMRPVEGVFTFLVPVILVTKNAFVSRKISRSDLFTSIALIVLSMVCLAIPLPHHSWRGLPLIFITSAAVVIYIGIHFYWKASNFLCASALFTLIPLVWFAPATANLYGWVYDANFSEISVNTGGRANSTVLQFFVHSIYMLGITAWILAGIAMLWMKQSVKFWKSHHLGLAVSMLLFPLAAGAITTNGDTRYYYAGNAVLILCAAIAALQPTKKFLTIRVSVVAVVILVQFFNCLNYIFQIIEPSEPLRVLLGRPVWNSTPMHREPLLELQTEIKNKIRSVQNAKFIILPLISTFGQSEWFCDPWVLTIRSRELGLLWTFALLEAGPSLEIRAPYSELKNNFDYIIVGPLNGSVDWPYFGNASLIAKEFETNPNVAKGLKLKKLGKIQTELYANHFEEFLLFKTERIVHPHDDPYHPILRKKLQ
jgi:hypothetical protein